MLPVEGGQDNWTNRHGVLPERADGELRTSGRLELMAYRFFRFFRQASQLFRQRP
jgi:hypothetical protein